MFILAQILGIVAFLLTTISLQFKKKSKILGMQIASNVAEPSWKSENIELFI